MSDPYVILGLPADADDDAIRRRYLQLVKQHPPESRPEMFAAIRKAYDSTKDLETRVRYRLFEAGKQESITDLIKELACRSSRRRLSLANLLTLVPKS